MNTKNAKTRKPFGMPMASAGDGKDGLVDHLQNRFPTMKSADIKTAITLCRTKGTTLQDIRSAAGVTSDRAFKFRCAFRNFASGEGVDEGMGFITSATHAVVARIASTNRTHHYFGDSHG